MAGNELLDLVVNEIAFHKSGEQLILLSDLILLRINQALVVELQRWINAHSSSPYIQLFTVGQGQTMIESASYVNDLIPWVLEFDTLRLESYRQRHISQS